MVLIILSISILIVITALGKKTGQLGLLDNIALILICLFLLLCGFFCPTSKYEENGTETQKIVLAPISEATDYGYFRISGNDITFKYSTKAEHAISNQSNEYKLKTISLSKSSFVFDNSVDAPYISKIEKKMISNIYSFAICGKPDVEYVFYLPENYGKIE